MDYYVVYDLNDQIVCFINNIFELHLFTNLPFIEIRRKFKLNSNIFFTFVSSGRQFKVYRFVD